jgi:hypothetical protein
MSATGPLTLDERTLVSAAGRSVQGQVQTSGPWLDGMISAHANSGKYASFQSQRAGYSPIVRVGNSS